METKLKQAAAEKVRRALTAEITGMGFSRTKPTFWTRLNPHTIEFIHLHLFRHGPPSFRPHLGIRVLNDDFEAPSLNGPMTSEEANFSFIDNEASIQACASAVAKYCREVGEPWFNQWREPTSLLEAIDSPLDEREKHALEAALQGKAEEHWIERSRKLFGVA